MNNTSINIAGKLHKGLVELYQDVLAIADRFGIQVLVVGAMARDVVLVHGYGAKIERGTRDVDFGINVATWDDFQTLKQELLQMGFKESPGTQHRLERNDSDGSPWEIDIIPFGEIASAKKELSWPPNADFVMSVVGFEEAHLHSIVVQISESPDTLISVASPAGIVLLKLIAWLERDCDKKPKDAEDINYIISSYSKIPEISGALYEDGHMEALEWDESLASARKIAIDCAQIASPEAAQLLIEKLLYSPEMLEQLSQQMPGYGYSSPEEQLSEFAKSFIAAIAEK